MKTKLLSALALLAAACSLPAQAVTYRYESTAYDRFKHYAKPCGAGTCLEFAPGNGVVGFFTTAEVLPPNLTENDVILPRITGWAFSDGQTVITHDAPGARVLGFRVATDAAGKPTHASILVSRWHDESNAPHQQGDRAQLIAARTSPYNPEYNQAIVNAPCTVRGTSAEGVADTCFGFNSADSAASTANYASGRLVLDAPLASISNGRVVEGNAGSTAMEFTVTLSKIPTENVSLRWRTVDGTATAAADYTAGEGSLAWAAGEDSYKTITIPIQGDTTPEPDETFSVRLGDFVGMAGDTATVGTGVILNDDGPLPPPQVHITDATSVEGGPGGVERLRFTVSLSAPPAEPFSLRWRTADGTATAPQDYASDSGSFTWAAGDASPRTITVSVQGDAEAEGNETMHIVLEEIASFAKALPVQATGTIQDDDATVPPPSGARPVPALSAAAMAVLSVTLAAWAPAARRARRQGKRHPGYLP
ncbi:hypothetical protein GCM10027082_11360 [Comamonas humi]